MSNQSNGIAVNFGVAGMAFAATGVGTGILQGYDRSEEADLDMVRDETGRRVQKTWYDDYKKATLTYIIKGTGLADAITQTKIPTKGTFLNISAMTSDTDMVATTWEVVGSRLRGTNTGAKQVTLDLEKAAGITAATSA